MHVSFNHTLQIPVHPDRRPFKDLIQIRKQLNSIHSFSKWVIDMWMDVWLLSADGFLPEPVRWCIGAAEAINTLLSDAAMLPSPEESRSRGVLGWVEAICMATEAYQGQVAFNTWPTQTLRPRSLWLQYAAALRAKERRSDRKIKIPFNPGRWSWGQNEKRWGLLEKWQNTSTHCGCVGVWGWSGGVSPTAPPPPLWI